MMQPVGAINGVIVVRAGGGIELAAGLGEDERIRSLARDAAWLRDAGERRVQPLTLDGRSYALLIAVVADARVILISEATGSALLELLLAVPFAHDVLEHLLSNAFEAMTIVDARKRLVYMSPIHEKFFGLRPGEGNGRPVREVIENTKLDRVITTGQPEIGQVQRMRGVERIVSRVPIRHDGKVVGAVGRIMFKGPEQMGSLLGRVNRLEGEVDYYRREAATLRERTYGLEHLIGGSPAMRKLRADIVKVAPLEIPVLVTGESGTGKELVAHSLHSLSPRREAPMVMLNAAALPATLVESELFGYEPGAFTGANKKGRRGKFEQAAGGTMFLDEIGDMPMEIQVKLLRVLQDQVVDRIGSDSGVKVDFRMISATNHDLRGAVADGRFRLDLYYRISAVVIQVPALRDRVNDVPLLAGHFLASIAERHARPAPVLTPDAIAYLMEQQWPGNVRQLRHEIERAFVFAEGGRITAELLEQRADGVADMGRRGAIATPAQLGATMQDAIAAVEVDMVRASMLRHKGNKKRVASDLSISRSYLYKLLTTHGID